MENTKSENVAPDIYLQFTVYSLQFTQKIEISIFRSLGCNLLESCLYFSKLVLKNNYIWSDKNLLIYNARFVSLNAAYTLQGPCYVDLYYY